MNSKNFIGSACGVGALMLSLAATAASPAPFTLMSSAFADGHLMPKKVSNSSRQNPNCVGENVSPPLSWKNPPSGTKSFALLLEDPEARGGVGIHHMVIYGIPPTVTGFAEGELNRASAKYVAGAKNPQRMGSWGGPCTPPGPPHHYTFLLIATDFSPNELPPGLTREEFLAKLVPPKGPSHAKMATGLVGLFKNPW